MFKKIYLLAIISTLFLTNSAFAQTDEGLEGATSSNLTNVSLPTGAMRVLPESVPSEVSETLEKLIAQADGKLQQGETEVLVWTGNNLKKTGKNNIINRLTGSLKGAGWEYEVTEEGNVSVFSLLKDGTNRRAIIGFFGEVDDTLVFAWTEILKADSAENVTQTSKTVSENKSSNGSFRSLVGTWSNGRVSTIGYKNTTTGTITSGGGNRFEYKFLPNGQYQYSGYMEITTYGCTTTLFSSSAGKYALNGATLNLTQSKNYWKQTNSCSAKSNSEKNQPLTKETYQFSTKTNEYNQELICLTNKNGETCYSKNQ